MNLLHDGEVEGVQEPAGVGDLVVGEHPVDVELGVRGEAQALLAAGDDPSYECAVTQTILQSLLIGPVRPLL